VSFKQYGMGMMSEVAVMGFDDTQRHHSNGTLPG
jgi:hypothetical protein